MYENEQSSQRVILVGIDTGAYNAEQSIDELAELCRASGGEVCAKVLQKLTAPVSATYIGGGKLLEVKELCRQMEADLLIFDDELSGAQIRNIEKGTGVSVIDRTMLILDIFALRARSKEGKIQVELAQQKYMLPRLIGLGSVLSRQGGGIGTRGPGETKLESDRRHIRRRIEALSGELKLLEKRREHIRRRRKKNDIPVIAIVGYTNVGKSSLLNYLTDAGVLAKNQLFATLDPTARELKLPDGQNTVLIDTVGLVKRLPHQLVEAFKSTLEEAAGADMILNLCDASSKQVRSQIEVTNQLLEELGCNETPVVTVLNKIDLLEEEPEQLTGIRYAAISVREERGIDGLLEIICDVLSDGMCRMKLLIPYAEGGSLNMIRRQGKILNESYKQNGILVTANIDIRFVNQFSRFSVE